MVALPGAGDVRRNAVVTLAPGVLLSGTTLNDVDGQVYELDQDGAALCAVFAEPADVETVVEGLSRLRETPPASLAGPIWEFVEDLSSRGLLSVSESFSSERAARLAELPGRTFTALTAGALPASEVRRSLRRYPGTITGLARAGLEAHQATAWIGVALVVAAAGLAFALSPTDSTRGVGVRTACLLLSGYFTLLLANMFIHESAHLVAARLGKCTVYGVYCRPSGMGISYTTASEPRRLAVTAAGPLAALALDLAVMAAIVLGPGIIWSAAGIDQLRLSAFAGVAALAAFQAVCLTPLARDGRNIATSLRAIVRKETARA
ncbi:hypothetical protein [Sinomonas sp. G460-2]|uniref:hypothetical protein n=1 Tax=Sinomonas sp. G460-2 TaxID=3393464 RepID=UPI0039F1276A